MAFFLSETTSWCIITDSYINTYFIQPTIQNDTANIFNIGLTAVLLWYFEQCQHTGIVPPSLWGAAKKTTALFMEQTVRDHTSFLGTGSYINHTFLIVIVRGQTSFTEETATVITAPSVWPTDYRRHTPLTRIDSNRGLNSFTGTLSQRPQVLYYDRYNTYFVGGLATLKTYLLHWD